MRYARFLPWSVNGFALAGGMSATGSTKDRRNAYVTNSRRLVFRFCRSPHELISSLPTSFMHSATLTKPVVNPPNNPTEESGSDLRAMAFVKGTFSPPPKPVGQANYTFSDESCVNCSFNVMPDRPVEETLVVREYRVWDGYIEAVFDRTYKSAMLRSPSHLTFLSALIHGQKLGYLLILNHCGLRYERNDPEFCKMWWTQAYSNIPKLIRQEKEIIQRFWMLDLTPTGNSTYRIEVYSDVCNSLEMWAKAPAFII